MCRTVLNVTGGVVRWLYFDSLHRSLFSFAGTAISLMYFWQEPIRAFLRIG